MGMSMLKPFKCDAAKLLKIILEGRTLCTSINPIYC